MKARNAYRSAYLSGESESAAVVTFVFEVVQVLVVDTDLSQEGWLYYIVARIQIAYHVDCL